MSVYFDVFAEINIKGEWHSLGPFVRKRDGSFELAPLYWAQSRFRPVDDELRGYAMAWGLPDGASEELLRQFHDPHEELAGWGGIATYGDCYAQCVYSVDFDKAIASRVVRDRPFKYCGYVPKHVIASFECGEVESIEYWYTKEEYDAFAKDERREYAYFEWNNVDDEYGIYSEIKQKVDYLKEWFIDKLSHSDSGFTWSDLEYTPVRLIVERA